jgi:hypothetical protein
MVWLCGPGFGCVAAAGLVVVEVTLGGSEFRWSVGAVVRIGGGKKDPGPESKKKRKKKDSMLCWIVLSL